MKQRKHVVLILMIFVMTIAGCSEKMPNMNKDILESPNAVREEAASSADTHNEPEEKKGWTFVDDEDYYRLQVNTEKPILQNRIQERHRADILELLVDDAAVPMTAEEIESIKADPNASRVDNVLPDGRFLKDNWLELQNKLLQQSLKVVTLNDNNTMETIKTTKFEAKLDTGTTEFMLKLQRLEIDGHSIIIPQESLPAGLSLIEGGKTLWIHADNGIWALNGEGNEFIRATPSAYNGETYDDLAKQAMDLFGEPLVTWNGGPLLSPDGTKLTYGADKHDIASKETALFVLDIATGMETLVGQEAGFSYWTEGWLDSSRIIGSKYKDSGETYMMVTVNGDEYQLELKGQTAAIYDVQAGKIAYYAPRSSGGSEFHIASVNETGKIHETVSFPLDGTSRQRGQSGFSPDNTYFAAIFVPDKEPEARYLKVLNIQAHTVIDIPSLPESVGETASIQDYEWLDEDTLLVTISEGKSNGVNISSWTYTIS